MTKLLNQDMTKIWSFILKHKVIISVILVSIILSSWLMCSTLGYKDGNIVISGKVWSDFNAHLPLIRSFSFGDNTPIEYPLFSGEKIRYHFFFYFLVGMLEKYGLRIDLALNLLSIIGFAGLMISIYSLALKLTKSKAAGVLSVVFFIFNSSLSWIYFIMKYPLGINTLSDIVKLPDFVSFGPYDDNIITAFWNLNIYINQRHFAFSFLLMFIAVWAFCYSKKKYSFFIGIAILAVMPITHKALLMILIIILASLFFALKEQRKRIFLGCLIGGILALPGITMLASASAGEIKIAWGYIYNNISWKELPNIPKGFFQWLIFWFLNLGVLPFLSLLGLIFIPKNHEKDRLTTNNKYFKKLKRILPDGLKKIIRFIVKIYLKIYCFVFSPNKVWFFIALVVFAIGNTFSFAEDLATNHKLFNFTTMIFGIYAAYFIVISVNKSLISKILSGTLCLFLIMGGIIDFFPNFNFSKVYIQDIEQNPTMNWIYKNTDKRSKFLNLTGDTFPILLAGRRIYYGQEYLNWSIGYPIDERKKELIPIVSGNISKENLCKMLLKNDLSYIFLSNNEKTFLDRKIAFDYFETNFMKENLVSSQYQIYNTKKSCEV